ncbi:hypothetical protein APS56_09515 [Pseudalgibacter alginicilyticus]|uniref:Uncharacterized protein n=1 Tax=Pseudalgibacter alginicilyticus TaxID=1736674 RepID=A0A0P0D950_9FLAO|nr:DUF805 domain-containing protein [Pseudalgibacter alginicilyticus]ALJ05349.1 hypothetical protein APS56_09515 [Pseudalgibacter alginicilyticus]
MNWYLKVLKQYADFKGRARRKEYWMFFLFNIIISYGIIFLSIGIDIPSLSILSSIYSLVVLIPGLAVGVRRMHDVGKSGWFLLIPIYNLILACTDSEAGTNKWGPNPKTATEEIDQIGLE